MRGRQQHGDDPALHTQPPQCDASWLWLFAHLPPPLPPRPRVTGRPWPSARRRSFFRSAGNRALATFDTEHVWTFHAWDQSLGYSTCRWWGNGVGCVPRDWIDVLLFMMGCLRVRQY